MVYIILGKGFEEAEALVPCDLLRRAGVETTLAGIGSRSITGGHGITVQADCVAEETELTAAEMIVLPGGLGGVESIRGSRPVMNAVRTMYEQGKKIAAICAAPTILAQLGVTEGKKVTCYPGMEAEMKSAELCGAAVAADGNVITGRAAGAAFDFALKLIKVLRGQEAADKVARSVVYQ